MADVSEADDLMGRFVEELLKATGDGQRKRKRGKPPWYVDTDHHRAMFSHYHKWLAGEREDPDSGAHPLVHMAWRALSIAAVETGNVPRGGVVVPIRGETHGGGAA